MMKLFVGLFLLSVSCHAVNQCSVDYSDVFLAFPKWIDLEVTSKCYTKAIKQTQLEIDASYTYLSIGAHFAQDVINRPGFADFFFKAAKEEREHATKLIEYLSMRGHLNQVSKLDVKPTLRITSPIESGAEAFKLALKLEEEVTLSIRDLIRACETGDVNNNYYHIVDWLTGVYLEEQLHGKRDLAGKLSQLKKMGPGALGEFLFDKTL